jgi:SAM-dependent methyltransferase
MHTDGHKADNTVAPLAGDLSQLADRSDGLVEVIAQLGEVPDRCLLCSASRPQKLFFRLGKWFWMCTRCELIFVHDIYPEFLRDAESLNDPARLRPYSRSQPSGRRHPAKLLKEFECYRRRNRLLDVGCADGVFLSAASAAGWRCSGVDILPAIAQMAREERGLDVRTGELFDAGFADGEFDVVHMNEVLEHVVDPVELMREVHRVLRPGGLALLRTGNARSWSARLRGGKWFYYQRFGGHGHIRFYNPKAARVLAQAAGFASVSVHTRGFAFLESSEMRGRLFKPFAKFAQNLISPLAGPCGAGHRLTLRFLAASA